VADDLLVTNIKEIDFILKNINWSFYPKPHVDAARTQLFNIRKYHWFPATFVPEIPYTLIELLTKPNASIFDPFLGIGTTYFQALLLNRIPYGADVCKIATDIALSALTLFDPSFDVLKIINIISSQIDKYSRKTNYSKLIMNKSDNKYVDDLKEWYTKDTFNLLCFLILLTMDTKEQHVKSALRISVSSILSTISNQDRGWGCIADNVLPKSYQRRKVDVIKILKTKLHSLLRDIDQLKRHFDHNTISIYRSIIEKQTIYHSDIIGFEEIPAEAVDLVLTSPPYPNMVDYVTSQRLSYYCFGYDSSEDKKQEIGARSKRFNVHCLDNYKDKMFGANKIISRVLKKGGLLCYIMPIFDSKNENNYERKSIIQRIIAQLEELNLTKETELERSMPSLRRSHNAKWATLQKEAIYIYRKL